MTDKQSFMKAALRTKDIVAPVAIVPFADWDYYYTREDLEWRSDAPHSRSVDDVKVPAGFVTDLGEHPKRVLERSTSCGTIFVSGNHPRLPVLVPAVREGPSGCCIQVGDGGLEGSFSQEHRDLQRSARRGRRRMACERGGEEGGGAADPQELSDQRLDDLGGVANHAGRLRTIGERHGHARQALVIGNGGYGPNLKLSSPPNDARAMAEALAGIGFHVTFGLDATFEQSQGLVAEFLSLVNAESTQTSLLYYSGHGLQIDDQNYIVPVDFDHFAEERVTKLVGVQSIVDQMTSATAVRLVLLDACRSNADARLYVGGKGIDTGKAIFVNDRPLPSSGLAEIRTKSNTFVAFAAAPGDVAYDGADSTGLSPFTQSLVRYLDAVDLPISNLTSRVRQDVLKNTDGRQRTWDQSSLMAPF